MSTNNDYRSKIQISQRQLEANRLNAQNSTGPVTPEGKRNSSKNAITHGLTATAVIIVADHLNENPAEFDILHAQLQQDLQPEGIMEDRLVSSITAGIWRQQRVYLAEAGQIRKQIHSARYRELVKGAERYNVSAYSDSLDARSNYLRSGTTSLSKRAKTLSRLRERIQAEGAVTQESIDKINLALGSDDGSLGVRLAAQLREERIDSESTIELEEANECQNSFKLHVQMIDREIACIKEAKIQIETEEAKSKEAELDSLAIPVGEAGNNIIRYEGAIRRQIAADCKELSRLQELRRSSGPLIPGQSRSGTPSLN